MVALANREEGLVLQPPILLLGMASAIVSPFPLHPAASTLKRQGEKATLFQKIWKQMEEPGAPPRTLTWEAEEPIQYLQQEFAESGSVPILAEGFDVRTGVVPMVEQKLKQGQKVLKKAPLARSML